MKTLYKLRECKTIQKDFYVFDTETNGLRAKSDAFIFGVIYSHNFVKVLYSVEEFKKEFEKPRYKNKKVFAHNAIYDLEVIYDNIFEMDKEAIFNGNFICATNGNCVFGDSMRIYPTSVKKIGSMLGIEKMELSEGFHTGNVKGVTKKDIDYCIRDCQIVYEALIRAFEFAGQICLTQASLSMAYFRRYHLPFNINFNDKLVNYFFNSYYGGRTEALKIGKTRAHVYDVNSMYPYVMKNGVFPNPATLKHYGKCPVKTFISKYLFEYEGCADIEIEHLDNWIGLLPFKKDGKLLFPVGTLKGWYNFPEIRYAIDSGIVKIKKVNSFVFGKKMNSIFSSFVSELYESRFATNDKFEIYRIKIYMNSLYGKFGQRIKENVKYIENIFDKYFLKEVDELKKKNMFVKLQMFSLDRYDAFLFSKKEKFAQPSYSIPSFASYITSYARIELLKQFNKYKDYSPVYCDTDSIFFEKELPEKTQLYDSNIPVLGAWKKENKIVTRIHGLKNYEYIEHNEEKRALKGVPSKAVLIDKNKWQYETLVKPKEGLRRGIDSGILKRVTKEIKNTYDKRIVLDNGETKAIKL